MYIKVWGHLPHALVVEPPSGEVPECQHVSVLLRGAVTIYVSYTIVDSVNTYQHLNTYVNIESISLYV